MRRFIALAVATSTMIAFAALPAAASGAGPRLVGTMRHEPGHIIAFEGRLTIGITEENTGFEVIVPMPARDVELVDAERGTLTQVTTDQRGGFAGSVQVPPGLYLTTLAFALGTPLEATSDPAELDLSDYPVQIMREGDGAGAVTSTPAGIDCGTACDGVFEAGTAVTLSATPEAASEFSGWTGACAGSATCDLIVDGPLSATAAFTLPRHTMSVSNLGSGSGTIASTPAGIFCGSTCSSSFLAGSTVTLSATPIAGSVFTGWSGDCSGTGSCVVPMSSARSVAATFTQTFPLTVTRTGAGTVSSNPLLIYCGSACGADVAAGTHVVLTATPDAGETFLGWSGNCFGTGQCALSMAAARSVSATFTNRLTVTRTGTGGGTITSSPAGISCGSTCSASFSPTATVTLTAAPDSNSSFAGWSGACTGSGSCVLTMSAARSVTATFTRMAFSLTVTRTYGGTVASSPAGIYCGVACSAAFDAGTVVTLTAASDADSTFVGWSGGACSGTGSCTISMTSAKFVSAQFTLPLSITKAGTGSGFVTSNPSGISCGGVCTASFQGGMTVQLSASPNFDSTFLGWGGACSGSGMCSVTMSQARSVTATFARLQYTLNVSRSGSGSGTVQSDPSGIDCGAACSAVFDAGTFVQLISTPAPGSVFSGWTGACAGSGSCVVSMNQSSSVTATFSNG